MLYAERRSKEPRVKRSEREELQRSRPPGEHGERIVRESALGARREHHEQGRRI